MAGKQVKLTLAQEVYDRLELNKGNLTATQYLTNLIMGTEYQVPVLSTDQVPGTMNSTKYS